MFLQRAAAACPQFEADERDHAAIAQELSSQYSLGYSPTNGRPDGRFRRISVRVVNRPELKLRARAGYTADGDSSLDSIRR